jgi:hypothetical protein
VLFTLGRVGREKEPESDTETRQQQSENEREWNGVCVEIEGRVGPGGWMRTDR